MAIDLSMKKIPFYGKIIIAAIPSVILIVLFIFLIYSPKEKEINGLNKRIVKLDSDIQSGLVKVRKLDELKVENLRLKKQLAKLKEQLPEEKEVSILLKQISDLGLKSGLEILLWKPEKRKPNPSGLYIEIPVKVKVVGGYHDFGVFFSHISRLPRIVNIADIKLSISKKMGKNSSGIITADFVALTFAAVSPKEAAALQKKKKRKK